eukprot:scaffold10863_cov195-Chaetoceros_neogracile.AAC.1
MLPRLTTGGIMPNSKYEMAYLQVSWDFNVRSPSRRLEHFFLPSAFTSIKSRMTCAPIAVNTDVVKGCYTGLGCEERVYDRHAKSGGKNRSNNRRIFWVCQHDHIIFFLLPS